MTSRLPLPILPEPEAMSTAMPTELIVELAGRYRLPYNVVAEIVWITEATMVEYQWDQT